MTTDAVAAPGPAPDHTRLLDPSIVDPSALPPSEARGDADADADHSQPSLLTADPDPDPGTDGDSARGAASQLLRDWPPAHPLIGPATRVVALGGGFAPSLIVWLAEHGFNHQQPVPPPGSLWLYPSAFDAAPVLAWQLRWAFGDLPAAPAPAPVVPTSKGKEEEEQRRAVRETLRQSDLLVLALGTADVWYDRLTGEPLWGTPPPRLVHPERHVLRAHSVAETVACLQQIEAIRATHLPHLTLLFTVSALPIRRHPRATEPPVVFRAAAHARSKAVIRAALDEFLRAQPPSAGGRALCYFPSFELVTEVLLQPVAEDTGHLRPAAGEQLLDLFIRTSTSLAPPAAPAAFPPDSPAHVQLQLQIQVQELRASNRQIQQVAEERQAVISQLSQAASERLALLGQLQQVAEERQAVIEQLSQAASERLALLGQIQQVAEERQAVISQLSQAASERLALLGQLQQVAEERQAVIERLSQAVRAAERRPRPW